MRKRHASLSTHTATRRPSGTLASHRRDTGPSGRGPARRKRDFGSRTATGEEELRLRIAGQDRASARELRNPAGPRASAYGPSGGTEASVEDPVFSGILASATMPKRWERGASSGLPSGEPPGPRPCRGARGETGKAASAERRTPEKAAREPPVSAPRTRKRPARDASPPRQGSGAGTVGAGSDAGPHYCFRASRRGWQQPLFSGMS
jgi:hypothetical protein